MPARRHRGEGAVYQRASDGLWIGSFDLGVIDGKRRRKVVSGRTQREAVRKLAEARREWETHGGFAGGAVTVEGWLTTWLDGLAADNAVRPRTLDGYRSKMAHVIDAIGTKRLDALEPEHVRYVYRSLAKDGAARSSIVQTHRILAHAIKAAYRERKVGRNVMELVEAPKVGGASKDSVALSRDEVLRLLAAIEGDRLESRWLFQLMTGTRQAEVLGLGWEDVDLDAGAVTIRRTLQRHLWRHGCGGRCAEDVRPAACPKRTGGGLAFVEPKSSESNRVLYLPPMLLASMQERERVWLAEGRADLSHLGRLAPHALVWGLPDGRPRDQKVDSTEWAALLDRAGVTHVGTHAARHGVASFLAALGEPVTVTQAILGHADPQLTMRVYTHTDEAAKRRALEGLERSLRGQTAIGGTTTG